MLITRYLAIVTALSSVCSAAVAENYAPRDYSIVPPSPRVAQFFELKDYEVNNRGIPDISYTLFELKSGAVTVPITLTYQGGGLRVEQKCGNAGMGWTVNCGANIGHTVYGAPDDAKRITNSGIKMLGLWNLERADTVFRNHLINKTEPGQSTDVFDSIDNYQKYGAKFMFNPRSDNNTRGRLDYVSLLNRNPMLREGVTRYYQGLTDVANDVYTIYGMGLSGVFAYDANRDMILSKDTQFTLKHGDRVPAINDGGVDGRSYVATDQRGLTYYFTTQDRTKYEYTYGSPSLQLAADSIYYASSWYLDEVEDLNHNNIKFYYHPSATRITETHGHSMYYKYWEPEMWHKRPSDVSSVTAVVYTPQILERIEANGIILSFIYAHEAFDSNVQPLIKEIRIKAPSGDCRTIQFKYKTIGNQNFLSEVLDQEQKILSFEYNDYQDGYYSQDFGGYFNNKNNEGTLIPTCNKIGLGADRSVDANGSTNGVLTKITYPTGGATEFKWEINKMRYIGATEYNGPPINASISYTTSTDTLRMCLDQAYKKLILSNYRVSEGDEIQVDLTKYFNMNPANLFGTDYYSTHSLETEYPTINPPNYPHIVFIRKDMTNGNTTVENVLFLDNNTIEKDGKGQPINAFLQPGIYDIKLVNPLSVSNSDSFLEDNMRYYDSPSGRIFINRVKYGSSSEHNNNWCGLRIKSIVSSTGIQREEPLRKFYYYDRGGHPVGATGVVNTVPEYGHKYYTHYSLNDGSVGYLFSRVDVIGTNAFPNTTHGSLTNISYPFILETMGKEDPEDPDEYLRYNSRFYSYSDGESFASTDLNETAFVNYQPVGSRMWTSKGHYRGNLMSKGVCRNGMSAYHKTSYEYNIYEDETTPFLSTNAFTICDYTDATGINKHGLPEYGIGRYHIIPYTKTIATESYEETDGLAINKRYNYFYNGYTDSPDYNLPKSVSSLNSDGEYNTTYFTYPLSVNTDLCSWHFPEPETEVTMCGDEVLSAKRNVYDLSGNLTQIYELTSKPAASYVLLSNDINSTASQLNLIKTLTYEYKYNSRGNLIEIRYRGRPFVSYLWGYNGLYPIIEAQNIDFETLRALAVTCGLSDNQISGSKPSTQTVINQVVDKMRTKRPDVPFTSLSYHWLFGLIKTTDQRGISSYYDYDNRGRLSSIRDFNNCLINNYQYHYATDDEY